MRLTRSRQRSSGHSAVAVLTPGPAGRAGPGLALFPGADGAAAAGAMPSASADPRLPHQGGPWGVAVAMICMVLMSSNRSRPRWPIAFVKRCRRDVRSFRC
jgi:hypothetical protein